MKKKILAVLVCAAVMMMTACDKSGITSTPTDSSNESSSTTKDSSSAEENTSSGNSTSSDTGISSDSSSKESEPASTAPESSVLESSGLESSTPESSDSGNITAGVTFVHGKQNGNVYTSEFMGFKVELADGWTLETEAQLAQANNIADMSDANVNATLNTNAMLYEMGAETEAVANMNITIENIDLTNKGESLSGEEYIDIVLDSLEAEYKSLGIEDVKLKKSAVSFLGSEEACIDVDLTSGGMTMVQKMIAIDIDRYMVTINLTGASDQEIESQIAMFKNV